MNKLIAIGAVLALAGCCLPDSTETRCVKSHTEMRVVPLTGVGGVPIGSGMEIIPWHVCDQYVTVPVPGTCPKEADK